MSAAVFLPDCCASVSGAPAMTARMSCGRADLRACSVHHVPHAMRAETVVRLYSCQLCGVHGAWRAVRTTRCPTDNCHILDCSRENRPFRGHLFAASSWKFVCVQQTPCSVVTKGLTEAELDLRVHNVGLDAS